MQRSNRTLKDIVGETLRKKLLRPFESRIFTACIAAAIGFFLFGWLPYKPTIPCTIEPAKVNHVVAPFDGVVATAPLFAGDVIKKGETLMTFDTRELELERASVASQIRSKEVSRNVAISQRDKATSTVLEAEIEALRVQERIAVRKIRQANVTAKLDGTIIRGDLREQLGNVVTKGTPLMEVAPAGCMKIQIQIPESQATLIKPGFEGVFAAGSNPADSHPFKITKVTPSTEIVDGQNVIYAEAEIGGQSDWMRSGMSGYAKVEAGWQPVWWIFGHRAIDSLRLGFWL